MRNFLVKFALFLLPLVILAYGADVFISSNLKKSNGFVKGELTVWNDLYGNNVNSKVLILGSSRAWVHVDAQMMSDSLGTSVYNLGIDGYNFWLQNYRRLLALKQTVKPKVIIQSIDVFTLEKRKDLFYSDQFLPYMLGNNDLETVLDNFIGYNPYDYKIPMIRYYGHGKAVVEALKMFVNPKKNPVTRVKGYQGQEKRWNNDLDLAKKKMAYYTAVLDARTVRLFENYLTECRNSNIKVVFVYCPEYIEGQQFIANRKEMIGVYSYFSKKYGIPFFDYSNNPMSYDRKYFYNALHMNKAGSELFTAQFIKDLKKMHLQY